jgi:hypothetical protein
VRRWLNEHDAGIVDHRKELWVLLILQLWLRHHNSSII